MCLSLFEEYNINCNQINALFFELKEGLNMTYIRCPRCELNYIDKKQKFCNVCKNEMKASGEIIDESDMKLCPVCHSILIKQSEDLCENCREELGNDYAVEDLEDSNWESYLDEDTEETNENIDDENEVSDVVENGSILDMDDEELGLNMDDEDFMPFADEDLGIDASEFDDDIDTEDEYNEDELDKNEDDFDDDFDDDDFDDEDDDEDDEDDYDDEDDDDDDDDYDDEDIRPKRK